MAIFGVILWRDSNTGQGLVWCEDQKDLALFDGEVFRELEASRTIVANDPIVFELDASRSVRRVSRVVAHWSAAAQPGDMHELSELLLRQASAR